MKTETDENIYTLIEEIHALAAISESDLLRIKNALTSSTPSNQCLNFYVCEECDHSWYDVYDCSVDMECQSCGERHQSPLQSATLLMP